MNDKQEWTREELKQAISDNLEGEWEDKLEVEIGRKIMEERTQDQIDSLREALRNNQIKSTDEMFVDWSAEPGKVPDEAPHEFMMPIIKKKYPSLRDVMSSHPIDWEESIRTYERLKEQVDKTGKAIMTVSQAIEPLVERPLSDSELEEARHLEDIIEDTLETKYDINNPKEPIEIVLDKLPNDRILDYLEDRYPAWTMTLSDRQTIFMEPNG